MKSDDGLTPEQQLAGIAEVAAGLVHRQQRCWADLQKRLQAEAISILGHEALTGDDSSWLRQLFVDRLLPVLTPIAIDPAHPFPFIPNRALAMVVELRREDGSQINALVLVPERVERFIRLPGGKGRFTLVEEALLAVGLTELFPGMTPLGHGLFRALRDSDIEIEEKAQDLVVMFESALKRRRRGQIIRLTFSPGTPDRLRDFVIEQTAAQPQDVVVLEGMVALSDVRQLITSDRPDLLFPPYAARFPERIKDYGGDCFAAIRAKDIVVHHPYELFDVVVQFLRQAADDPNVIAIKQTLYRTSEDSPIVAALVDAAEVRQVRHGIGRIEGAVRRGTQYPLGPAVGAGRRASHLWLCRSEDARQGLAGRASRGRDLALLRAFWHRQLSSGHRQDLYRPVVFHL